MLTDDVRSTTFRQLLTTCSPITPHRLADDLARPEAEVADALDALRTQGLVRVDSDGRIVGAAGLNVTPDRHQIDLDGRRYWTWCAYDFLGIFAATGASGAARSITPDTGSAVEVRFRRGRPDPVALVLFLPDDPPSCTSAYEQWCPHSNLFHSPGAARAWAAEHGIPGEVLALPEAAARGAASWRTLTHPAPLSEVQHPIPQRSPDHESPGSR